MPRETTSSRGRATDADKLLDAWFVELKAFLSEAQHLLEEAETAQAESQTRARDLFVSEIDRRFEKLGELRKRHRQAAIRERLSD